MIRIECGVSALVHATPGATGPLARFRSFFTSRRCEGAFVRLGICDCLVGSYHLIGRHEFRFRAAPMAMIDELAVGSFSETEH